MNSKDVIQAMADLDEDTIANVKKIADRARATLGTMFPYQRRPSAGARVLQGGGFVLLGVAVGVAGVAITYAVNPKLLASVGKLIRETVHDAESAFLRASQMILGKAKPADRPSPIASVKQEASVKDEGARHRAAGNGHKSHSPS
jgi:hypothetical protein